MRTNRWSIKAHPLIEFTAKTDLTHSFLGQSRASTFLVALRTRVERRTGHDSTLVVISRQP